MRIALTTSSLPPARGIATYVHELTQAFLDLGHEVKVYCISPTARNPEDYPYPVKMLTVPPRFEDEWQLTEELLGDLLAWKPDAFLISDTPPASSLLPVLPETIVRGSFVHAFRTRFGMDQCKIIGEASALLAPWLDWLVTGNRFLREQMIEAYNLPGDQVREVLYGISQPPLEARPFSERPVDKTRFLFAGGHHRLKAPSVMLNAAKRLLKERDDWELYFAGTDRRLPLGSLERVTTWLGNLPRQKLFEVMNECHVLVTPSIFETGPMLMLEGLAMGLVPLVSDTPSAMREIVEATDFGFIAKTGDDADLARAMREILVQRDSMPERSQRALTFQREQLTIRRQAEDWLALLSVPREGRRAPVGSELPDKLYPFHRRPYRHSRLDPRGIFERWQTYRGILPGPITRSR